ncbi:MAG TPA: hypothetical protein ENG48_00245 [Candidatus Atribacteria bacterium]|nr:hypothetical protein [Candidatus Atribacteria bacterium]
MLQNKRIGFDLDGVLYNWQSIAFHLINKKHNYKFGEREFWSRKARSNRFYGKHRQEIEDIASDPNTYFMEELSNINKEVLRILKSKGNELFYITARPEHLRPVTELWLNANEVPDKHNLFMPYPEKTDIIKELKLDVYLDDRDYIIQDALGITNAYLFWATYLSRSDMIKSGLPYLTNLKSLLYLELEE